LILNIVYSPDEAHKSTQLIHRLISKSFREDGLDVREYYMVESECEGSSSSEFSAITTSKITKKKGIWKYIPSGLTRRLCNLTKDNKSKFVVCDGLGVARPLFPVLKKQQGLKLIVVIHGFVKFKSRDLDNFNIYSNRVKLVLVSSSLAQEIYDCYPALEKLSCVIPNTLSPGFVDDLLPKLEARKRLGLPEQSRLYVVASRLSSKKDVTTAIRAYAKISSNDNYLVIMGDGPDRPILESLVSSLGIAQRVIWLGWVSNSNRYLNAFDVFVSASTSEGFGLSVFEAHAAGLPVVCTNIVPHQEALESKGFYFEVGDVAGCAEKLVQASYYQGDNNLNAKYQRFAAAYLSILDY
jgi:glycosyltransferase involved in cell wall biosynthesis